MSRMFQAGLLAAIIVAGSASSVRADWWVQYGPYSSYYRTSYYYYPVYYYPPAPVAVCPPVIAQPVINGVGYAQPMPAPASGSQTKEPPLAKKIDRMPQVSESRSFSIGDGKGLPTLIDASGKEICRVGFWNVSGRDVKLTVNGSAVTLPSNRSTTLTVSRSFTWQIDSRPSQSANVPDEQVTHEIVIR